MYILLPSKNTSRKYSKLFSTPNPVQRLAKAACGGVKWWGTKSSICYCSREPSCNECKAQVFRMFFYDSFLQTEYVLRLTKTINTKRDCRPFCSCAFRKRGIGDSFRGYVWLLARRKSHCSLIRYNFEIIRGHCC